MARRPLSWTVQPIHVEGEWQRGPARLIDDVTLEFVDPERVEDYPWAIAGDLPYDLAGIRHSADILGFVRRWGFLDRTWEPILPGLDAIIPTVEDFQRESLLMNYTLYLYGLVGSARSPAAERALAEYWAGYETGVLNGKVREWLWNPHDRPVSAESVTRVQKNADFEQMAVGVREELEEVLQRYGGRVLMSVRSLDLMDWRTGEPKPPGQFLLTSQPLTLRARAYLEVALEMTAGVTVAACPEDGRMFAVRDPRQVYCSTQCAGRARYRKWASRKTAPADPSSNEPAP